MKTLVSFHFEMIVLCCVGTFSLKRGEEKSFNFDVIDNEAMKNLHSKNTITINLQELLIVMV